MASGGAWILAPLAGDRMDRTCLCFALLACAGVLVAGCSPVGAVGVVLNSGKQRGTASNGKLLTEPPKIDTKTQTIVRLKKKGKRQKVAKVEPDQGMGAGRGSPAARGIFKGGNGFQGGQG